MKKRDLLVLASITMFYIGIMMGNTNKSAGTLFIISGPSGVGKTTLVEKVLQDYKDKLLISKAVTYTTRTPRKGEVDGVDYYFLSKDEFEQKVNEGFFIEWDQWADNYYGSGRNVLEEVERGYNYILILDRQGAVRVVQEYPDAVTIWISVPSINILKERLRKRGTESEEKLQKRLLIAKDEMGEENLNKWYRFHIKNLYLKQSLGELIQVLNEYISVEN